MAGHWTSHPDHAATDAKRILASLRRGDRERRLECIADATLLRSRGAGNGLAAFLDEVEERSVPAFARTKRQ